MPFTRENVIRFFEVCFIGFLLGCVLAAYFVFFKWLPEPNYRHVRTGKASWYAGSGLVAACRYYKPGTWVLVKYGNARVTVKITSAGPAWRFFRRRRIIDLSRSAFNYLEKPNKGLIPVTIEPVAAP